LGFTRAARCSVQQATFELSVAGARKGIPIISMTFRLFCSLAFGIMLAACDGPQSALMPAGEAAERIAGLFWWMTGFAAAIWIAVIALALYAVGMPAEQSNRRRTNVLIIGGGAVVPTVAVAVLALFGLAPIPALLAPALRIGALQPLEGPVDRA
jgi:heme/copper-type cytochrome/quinol oxidase subunit 2